MKKINTIQLVFTLIFFTSCAKEFNADDILPLPGNGTSQEISIQLNTPSSFVSQLRSLSESQESAINDVCILAFKTGVLSYIRKATSIDNDQKVKVTLKSSDNSSDTYKLVILANAYDMLLPLTGNDLEGLNGKTYDEIQQILNQTGIDTPLYQSGGDIVMWGELPYQEIKSTNSNFSVYLVRSIARIDVGAGAISYDPNSKLATWGGLANFTLEEVYVYKANNAYSFIPQTGNFDDAEKKVTYPSPIGNKLASPLSYSVSNSKSIVRSIYLPEADVKMGTQGISGDSNHTNRVAIIVKGSYNGNTSSYFRLDFINSEKALTNILRNHIYQFNIKSVSGNGHNSPDEAYQSQATNMDVEVLDWNDGAIGDIIFDSQYMLGVSKSLFTFTKEQQTSLQTENKLTITTDVPEGWNIEKIIDENGNTSGAMWLTLDNYSGPANMKTTISLLIDKNTTGSQRKAYIHIIAGRLRYVIEVIQTSEAAFIPKKRFLTIGGDPNGYGYNFSGTSASNRLITAYTNFGTTPVSVVKTEGFTIINGGESPSEAQMYEWLINNPVDIVVLGFNNHNINATIAQYYKQFLINKGVVIAFQEGTGNLGSGNLLRAVLGNNISISSATGAGSVYQFSNLNNEVLNGPFGDIRGKQWGEDASITICVSGFNPNDVDILSDNKDISTPAATGSGAATGFKHNTLNFIWFGDAGFNSYSNGSTSNIVCPFTIDMNNFPVAKPGYGRGTIKYPVYNSVLTANALAWALKQAEKKDY
jgi:hypothetical protein